MESFGYLDDDLENEKMLCRHHKAASIFIADPVTRKIKNNTHYSYQ